MEQENQKIEEIFDTFLNEHLKHIIFSNSCDKEKMIKAKVRPVMLNDGLKFQIEEWNGKQVHHRNYTKDDSIIYFTMLLESVFKQMELESELGTARVLVSKKGNVTVKVKKQQPVRMLPADINLSHNRKKKYILEEGISVPFLEELGVMTSEGKIVRTKYDKFRQINRFLEFIEDILPELDSKRESTIIDFGCGKSYLTFAMYYYLKVLKGYPVNIIGLDLKKDVIKKCSMLSEKFGYDTLRFYYGDVASYDGVDKVDMVVTLHACDTATDYALEKAVRWGAKVILSVPCCQHELNQQMKNELLAPVLDYGLIKERMAALYTDALRAEILEHCGYRSQILEFIDMEHTPKNILIRAVKKGKPKDNADKLSEIMKFLDVNPTLAGLLLKEEQ